MTAFASAVCELSDTNIVGGSTQTGQAAETVMPQGRPSMLAVTSTTPDAK
jgi:hypothetical protein